MKGMVIREDYFPYIIFQFPFSIGWTMKRRAAAKKKTQQLT